MSEDSLALLVHKVILITKNMDSTSSCTTQHGAPPQEKGKKMNIFMCVRTA